MAGTRSWKSSGTAFRKLRGTRSRKFDIYAELLRLFDFFNDEQRITLKHVDSKFFADAKFNEKQKLGLSLEELKQRQEAEEIALIKYNLRKYGSLRDAASEGLKCPYTTMYSRMIKLKITHQGDENEKNS